MQRQGILKGKKHSLNGYMLHFKIDRKYEKMSCEYGSDYGSIDPLVADIFRGTFGRHELAGRLNWYS